MFQRAPSAQISLTFKPLSLTADPTSPSGPPSFARCSALGETGPGQLKLRTGHAESTSGTGLSAEQAVQLISRLVRMLDKPRLTKANEKVTP